MVFALCVCSLNMPAQSTAPIQTSVTGAAAKIVFKEAANKHEFGIIPQGTPVSYSFTFSNTGKTPLVLTAVSASCGCITPEWPKGPIAPGGTASIKTTYNAVTVGQFTKTVTVVSNDPLNPTTILTIHGEVKPVH